MPAGAIRAALEAKLGLEVTGVALTSGGDINDAYRAETSSGPSEMPAKGAKASTRVA